MGEQAEGISVGCLGNRVYARVAGRGTFQNSQPLRQFAMEKIDQGQEEFIIDLGLCQAMDSTFLGMLVGIGLRLRQTGPTASVRIVNMNARNLNLLQTLGLDGLFRINGDTPAPLADADYYQLPGTDTAQLKQPFDKSETADLMIESHDNLVRANPRNTPRFKELARFLREVNRSPTPPTASR
jgi:anti-anti-sigma regulatory factor